MQVRQYNITLTVYTLVRYKKTLKQVLLLGRAFANGEWKN